MPSVVEPIPLYTVPEKGAPHSGTALNKEDCCIEAMQSIRIALVCLMRVTLQRVEVVGQRCIDNGILDGILFFFPGNFQSRQALTC
jgi:hypothetical protein